ncbi:MAG: hypothetical protein ACK6D1_15165 [Planctomycetota bacterium]
MGIFSCAPLGFMCSEYGPHIGQTPNANWNGHVTASKATPPTITGTATITRSPLSSASRDGFSKQEGMPNTQRAVFTVPQAGRTARAATVAARRRLDRSARAMAVGRLRGTRGAIGGSGPVT